MNFTVPVPAAGPTAIVEFSFDDLAKLQDEFGVGYAHAIGRALDQSDAGALRQCLTIGGHGGDFESAMKSTPYTVLAGAVSKALLLRLVGEPDDAD